jgi:hypothetical protein
MGCQSSKLVPCLPSNRSSKRGLLPGINLRFLKRFQQLHAITDQQTTADVVGRIIKPETTADRISYSDLIARSSGSASFVGAAHCMISHAWACSFNDTVAAIESHCREQPDPDNYFVLLDIFYINQHDFAQVNDKNAMYEKILAQLTQMVVSPTDNLLLLCIDSWEHPVLIERAWCLFEVAVASKFNIKVKGTLPKKKLQDFYTAVIRHYSAVEAALTKIDVANAQATVESDKLFILSTIKNLKLKTGSGELAFNQLLQVRDRSSPP